MTVAQSPIVRRREPTNVIIHGDDDVIRRKVQADYEAAVKECAAVSSISLIFERMMVATLAVLGLIMLLGYVVSFDFDGQDGIKGVRAMLPVLYGLMGTAVALSGSFDVEHVVDSLPQAAKAAFLVCSTGLICVGIPIADLSAEPWGVGLSRLLTTAVSIGIINLGVQVTKAVPPIQAFMSPEARAARKRERQLTLEREAAKQKKKASSKESKNED